MIIKICAAAGVLAGCGWLGVCYGSGFGKRVKELRELQNAMMQFEFDIDYLGAPIEQTIEKLSKGTSSELKEGFLYMTRRLQSGPVQDMESLWLRAIERNSENLMLSPSDIEILRDFAALLGTGSREKELNNIKVTSMRLKIAEDEARASAEKNTKMYRGLGLLLGIFIVVMMI